MPRRNPPRDIYTSLFRYAPQGCIDVFLDSNLGNVSNCTFLDKSKTHQTAKAAGYTYKEKEPYCFAEVDTEKTMHPVILLHPAPTTISVKRSDSSGEKAATSSYLTPKTDAPKRDELLQNGDFTGEGYAYTVKAFWQIL